MSASESLRARIREMRNIYNSYLLCKNIERNIEVHNCGDDACDATGEVGTSKMAKHKQLNKKLTKDAKSINTVSSEFLTEFTRWMRYEKYAEDKGYIEVFYCKKGSISFASITNKGLDLTDNVFGLSYTPLGLVKEIVKQNKYIITVGFALLYLWSRGITINNITEYIADKI